MTDITAAPKKKWGMGGRDPYAMPLADIDLSHPAIWHANEYAAFLQRLREEAPVHYCAQSAVGPYWSIMRYDDIMTVDTAHEIFSSEPSIAIVDGTADNNFPSFIALDPPKHDQQRRAVQGLVAPVSLQALERDIRQRVVAIFDTLPYGEIFNWVDRVSVEFSTQMLALLFDFPFEDRHLLAEWSDAATSIPGRSVVQSFEQRQALLRDCLNYFTRLWNERVNSAPRNDWISMMAHNDATRHFTPTEYLGNLLLLIVAGNDTTRHSITGGVLALHENPAEYQKLRANPSLIPNMASEIIRWQTPLAHMRRTARVDTVLGGQTIRAGEKVIMWYASGNLDNQVFDQADKFQIDRPNARKHLSFGYGVHRCMGNRLAELQLRIIWEEILQRFQRIEVVGPPQRVYSSFVKGYTELAVIVYPCG